MYLSSLFGLNRTRPNGDATRPFIRLLSVPLPAGGCILRLDVSRRKRTKYISALINDNDADLAHSDH